MERRPIDPSAVLPPPGEGMPPVPPPDEERGPRDLNKLRSIPARAGRALGAAALGFAGSKLGIDWVGDFITPDVLVPESAQDVAVNLVTVGAGVRSAWRNSTESPREQQVDKLAKWNRKLKRTGEDHTRRKGRIEAVGGGEWHDPTADPKGPDMQPVQRPRPKWRRFVPGHSTALREEERRGRRRRRKWDVQRKAGQVDGQLVTEHVPTTQVEGDYISPWGETPKYKVTDEEGRVVRGPDGKPVMAPIKAGIIGVDYDKQRTAKRGVDIGTDEHIDRIETRPEARHRRNMRSLTRKALGAMRSRARSGAAAEDRIDATDLVGKVRLGSEETRIIGRGRFGSRKGYLQWRRGRTLNNIRAMDRRAAAAAARRDTE